MTQPPLLPSEQLASEWATRLCSRLSELNVHPEEVEETRQIFFHFTQTACNELSKDRVVPLSYTEQPLIIDSEKGLLIIELFLRGIFQSSQQLRETGQGWQERRPVIEALAWKIFSLSKLLVGFWYIPHEPIQPLLRTKEDLQSLLQQSTQILVEEALHGTKGITLPFSLSDGQEQGPPHS